MKKFLLCISFLLFSGSSASAATISLYDWAFFVDGETYQASSGVSMPVSGSLDADNLGTLAWATDVVGYHTVLAFFDYELDAQINGLNKENGSTSGSPTVGLSYEIDEPGYVFGDIYNHLLAGELDNMNSVSPGLEEDVSIALGWNFLLNDGESAFISLVLSNLAPLDGFYIKQHDLDSDTSIYFSSTLEVEGSSNPIPEPATMLLLGSGIACLFSFKFK
jgi:hypothetical protein